MSKSEKFKPPRSIKIDVKNQNLERGFNDLPFFYIDNNNPHIFWMCNYDQDGKIVSLVKNTRLEERSIAYLNNMDEAIAIRNNLIRLNWAEGQMPVTEVNQENWDAIPRQQKKRIIRQLAKKAIKEEKDEATKKRLKEQLKGKKKKKEKIKELNNPE